MDNATPLPATPPKPLRPTLGLSRFIIALVGMYVLANLVQVTIQYVLRSTVGHGQPMTPLLTQLDGILVQLPRIEGALYMVSGISFLVLVSRLVGNLPALGSATLLTPSQAVWSFIIPIVNLAGGYTTTRTIWTESQPSTQDTLRPRPVPLLGWWWGSYLALCISGQLMSKLVTLPEGFTIEQWADASYWSSMQSSTDCVAGPLFMVVVYLLDRRQREQHQDLVLRVPVTPRDDLFR